MKILRTENLIKTYETGHKMVKALDEVSFSVDKGDFVCIIGASGSGKSTLLHMLGGVDRPTQGKIYIDDIDISDMNETELAIFRRRKMGIIYQFCNLIPTLNVEKNILLPMALDGRKPDKARFNKIITMLDLNNRLSHFPSQLSGGQQQRVAIGRSLIYRPSIILADEPTGNLDRKNSESIIELLKVSNKEYKQTIVLITHDEKIAMQANRIITIEDGKILSDEVIR